MTVRDVKDFIHRVQLEHGVSADTILGYYREDFPWDEVLAEARKPLVDDSDRVEVILLTIRNDRDIAEKVVKGILKSTHPFKLTVYENSLNTMNTSKIWNKLIRESTCPYQLILDSDAFPQHDIITPLYAVMKQHPDCIIAAPVGWESAIPEAQNIPHNPKQDEFLHKEYVSGCCFMTRKDLIEKENLWFDEDFLFYGQDADWNERIHENGKYTMYIVPKAHILHGIGNEASLSSRRPGGFKIFPFEIDQPYGSMLWKLKKDMRKHG
jgi:hypothetical protein